MALEKLGELWFFWRWWAIAKGCKLVLNALRDDAPGAGNEFNCRGMFFALLKRSKPC